MVTKWLILLVSVFLLIAWRPGALAAQGDWPEPRQNPRLTGVQPLAGAMKTAPGVIGRYDLGRSAPRATAVASKGLCVVAGALLCYDTAGALQWKCHPPGLNSTAITTAEDLDGDDKIEVLLSAGRPCEPYGAAALISLDDGRLLWRYDVEPMSYAWYLFADHYLPKTQAKQIVVMMHAYPPDPKNGYIALFEFTKPGEPPTQKWRCDFSEYTCFPSLLQTDLEGDGILEMVVETHSRMWILDAVTGAVRQFYKWDVSPANVRSYGFVKFVDLNGDKRDDFLCIANFAQHHEVLLNRDGKMEKAWGFGWPESVTTGKVATTWGEPPYADVDGDNKLEIVLSMYNSEGENAWLLRIYDAVTGTLKYRLPGEIAVSCIDIDHNGVAEILANESSDPTRVAIKGARLYTVRDGKLEAIWRDDTVTAIEPKRSGASPDGAEVARVERRDEKFALQMDAARNVTLAPWEKPMKETGQDFSAVPAIVGPAFPVLLAADVDADGRNEVILYQEPSVKILKFSEGAFSVVGEYTSTSAPVIADLDGDGKAEIVLSTVSPEAPPIIEAKTPSQENKTLWRTECPPPDRTGMPQPRKAYMRTAHFTGKPTPDLYLWAGTPVVRSMGLEGTTGQIVWDKGETPGIERYWGPSVNLASVFDFDEDKKEDLIFTNPDYYCVASGVSGDSLLGPLFPPQIFSQPSQGLYTFPAILEQSQGEPTVSLIDGHYFQGAMSLHAKPYWYKLPAPGENRAACEGFLRTPEGAWLMGFGRQNGNFACVNVRDGSVRWELPVEASCSDVVTCDVDGDGSQEFVFGTSHNALFAVGDGGDKPRVVWKTELSSGSGPPVAADIDADNRSEIIVPTSDGYVQVFGIGCLSIR